MKKAVLKDTNFTLLREYSQPDAKNRISLGGWLAEESAFNIYQNSAGQIILDPVKAVPTSELWLWNNPAALSAVKRGLEESAAGKTTSLGSFSKHAK